MKDGEFQEIIEDLSNRGKTLDRESNDECNITLIKDTINADSTLF